MYKTAEGMVKSTPKVRLINTHHPLVLRPDMPKDCTMVGSQKVKPVVPTCASIMIPANDPTISAANPTLTDQAATKIPLDRLPIKVLVGALRRVRRETCDHERCLVRAEELPSGRRRVGPVGEAEEHHRGEDKPEQSGDDKCPLPAGHSAAVYER